MSEIEKRARELLAAEYEKSGSSSCASAIRSGELDGAQYVRAIIAALVPPDGYVLVPACPTNDMIAAGNEAEAEGKFASEIYLAMLSERPEPSNVKK